ncbi:kinase [Agromyces rhizosphaerae]|uniref:Kinase n=1 Tax=Agromyces rhizosphaerae TaxID=88374 RepID=A0A9W6CTD6_9MICO|nr:ATP-binding protein [Agromyces rhizosphaerae]GLI25977.1 kinase [Agromyces rhizosphaerae]
MTDAVEVPEAREFDELRVPRLIAMAGLPGAGKSTIAEVLGGRLGAPVVSVDPIESAILRAGIAAEQPTGLAAYLVAETIAEGVLASGRTVIVDAVNAVESARLQWRDLAVRCGVQLRVIEVVCSDEELHRDRLVSRTRNLPHLDEVTWRAVEQSVEGYQPWAGPAAALPRVTLDTVDALGVNVDEAFAFLDD